MNFEHDPRKAETNLRKHGVRFEEAVTVFFDPLRGTEIDEEHSPPAMNGSAPSVIPATTEFLRWFILKTTMPFASSAHGWQSHMRSGDMKTSEAKNKVTPAKLVRGKYSSSLEKGANVVILDPALLELFPDSESVNVALHAFLSMPEADRAAAIQQSRSKVSHRANAFDPRVGTLEKAS